MSKPKDGEIRTKDGKKQKYNAYTGRWVTQTNQFEKGSTLRKLGRLIIREPSPETLAEAKRIREKKGKDAKKKNTWTSGKRFTKAKDTSKRSPGSSQYTQQESKASKTGPLGGTNPYYKEKKKYGEDFKNAPKLKIDTKYENGKPSADATSSKSKSKKETKKDKLRFPGGKDKYTAFEKSGARQSSARNSVARSKYKRKRDKLKAGG